MIDYQFQKASKLKGDPLYPSVILEGPAIESGLAFLQDEKADQIIGITLEQLVKLNYVSQQLSRLYVADIVPLSFVEIQKSVGAPVQKRVVVDITLLALSEICPRMLHLKKLPKTLGVALYTKLTLQAREDAFPQNFFLIDNYELLAKKAVRKLKEKFKNRKFILQPIEVYFELPGVFGVILRDVVIGYFATKDTILMPIFMDYQLTPWVTGDERIRLLSTRARALMAQYFVATISPKQYPAWKYFAHKKPGMILWNPFTSQVFMYSLTDYKFSIDVPAGELDWLIYKILNPAWVLNAQCQVCDLRPLCQRSSLQIKVVRGGE